jgi:hypothetical protein
VIVARVLGGAGRPFGLLDIDVLVPVSKYGRCVLLLLDFVPDIRLPRSVLILLGLPLCLLSNSLSHRSFLLRLLRRKFGHDFLLLLFTLHHSFLVNYLLNLFDLLDLFHFLGGLLLLSLQALRSLLNLLLTVLHIFLDFLNFLVDTNLSHLYFFSILL